jgi:hypothetical protein
VTVYCLALGRGAWSAPRVCDIDGLAEATPSMNRWASGGVPEVTNDGQLEVLFSVSGWGRHRVCKPIRASAETISIGFDRRNFQQEGSLITFLLFSIAIGIPAQVTAQRPWQLLSCDPKQVRSGDTLILRFRMPHPEELAIRAPGNGWYFLVFEPDPSTPRPIVDKASFAKMREMRLPVATAKGIPCAAGKNNPEVIFQRPGTYEVILTAALESEDVVPTYRCKVAFARNR